MQLPGTVLSVAAEIMPHAAPGLAVPHAIEEGRVHAFSIC